MAAFKGFDDLAAWTLEKMLKVNGTATVEVMAQYLKDAVSGSLDAAADSPLRMSSLGPEQLPALPLQVARLREHQGGLGLPTTHMTCIAAYTAQMQTTLGPAIIAASAIAGKSDGPIAGLAQAPVMTAYAGALMAMATQSDMLNKLDTHRPALVMDWALGEAGDDRAAYTAATAPPLTFLAAAAATTTDGATTTTTNTVGASNLTASGRQHKTGTSKGMQKKLTDLLNDKVAAALHDVVKAAGDVGKLCMAQLRSQAGPYAQAWRKPRAGLAPLPAMHFATMLLVTLFVDCWGLTGPCPYRGCTAASASTAHAIGCTRQPDRGVHATHTAMKRALQRLCYKHHVRSVSNENCAPFTDPKAELRMDTVLPPGSLSNCADGRLQTLGVLLDTSVVTPTAQTYVAPVHESSASVDGYAATAAESRKDRHYGNFYNHRRWRLVTMAQESYGRLGRQGAAFLQELATHSARCKGGSVEQVGQRRAQILTDIRTEMSLSLARELAERLNAYARSSRQAINPVSALLTAVVET